MLDSDSDDYNPEKNKPAKELGSNEIVAPTKQMYRMITWRRLKDVYKGTGKYRYVKRKVPLFPQAEEAAEKLADTPEFKEAKNIKVNIDLAQEWVKLQVVKAEKTLFVAASQHSDHVYAKIKPPYNLDGLDETLVAQRSIVKTLTRKNTLEKLAIDQTEPLDMIVVGCVAVSQDGRRIGKGKGYVDLEIAVLHSLGVITPKTVIATTVSDKQVFPELPAELFQPFDFTVDLIVTPTTVYRVNPRPENATIGVQWGLISPRRLEVMRVLKLLKKRLEDEGQKIELKEVDTDVESSMAKRGPRGNGGSGGQQRRRPKRNRWAAKNDHGDDDAKPTPRPPGTITDGDDTMQPRKPPTNRGRGGGGGGGGGGGRRYRARAQQQKPPSSRPPRPLKPELQNGVRIGVSNMFSVPFKVFKDELRNRDCYPAKINRGRNGRCLLIFPKREDAEEQVQVDELLQKLADMRISVPQKNSAELKQIMLKCELLPKPRDFDENDATSITAAANRALKRASEACAKLAKDVNTATTDANNADTERDANTNNARVNVDDLAAEVNAATLLAARAAKAAEAIVEKVLQETKPAIEAVNGEEEENKEHAAKLLAQVETLTKAGAEALAAGTKAEKVATDTADAAAAATAPTASADDPASAAVTESAASKQDAINTMFDAIQEAGRATLAVSFAVTTLYELVPPAPAQQYTVKVAPMQTLTHLFNPLVALNR